MSFTGRFNRRPDSGDGLSVRISYHYKNENYWYGVSTPFIDAMFGMLKNEKDIPLSDTVKDLERRGHRMQ